MSSPECITWMTAGLAESVAIVTLNICTILVFTRNRNFRKRSTYLIINLAVTDMLVGGAAVYHLFYWIGVHCNVWKGHLNFHLADRLLVCFPGMSYSKHSHYCFRTGICDISAFEVSLAKKTGVWPINCLCLG